MSDPIIEATDSAGGAVVIVKDKVTHLVSSGDAHTEVYLIGGTYVRVRGSIEALSTMLWKQRANGQ